MSRPRSLGLSLEALSEEVTADGPFVLRREIFNSVVEAGIDRTSIEGIECVGKMLWYIVFYTRQQRVRATGKTIKLNNEEVELKGLEPPRPRRPTHIHVKVVGYPLDTDSKVLEQTLSLYGNLVAITDDLDGRINIKTGIKYAKYSSLTENIPSFIYAGRFRVRTMYRDQPKTCRNCMQTGHEARECTAGVVCRQCGKPGHKKGECPEKRCFHCKEKGHEQRKCTKYGEDFPSLLANDMQNGRDAALAIDQNTEENNGETQDEGGENTHGNDIQEKEKTDKENTGETETKTNEIATVATVAQETRETENNTEKDESTQENASTMGDESPTGQVSEPKTGKVNPELPMDTEAQGSGETQNDGAKDPKTRMENKEDEKPPDEEEEDSERSDDEKEEPPLKTRAVTTTDENKTETPPTTTRITTQDQRQTKSHRNRKKPAVAVSTAKTRNPFHKHSK